MPLINLTTDLKSLQYGGDRPGGGSSGLPYVVSPRPEQITTPTFPLAASDLFSTFYNLNRYTQDYPIRGGSSELNGETGFLTTPAGRIDRGRIKAFMNDPQKGKIFLLKQTGLQLSNPKTPGPSVLAPLDGSRITGLLEGTRFYNPTGINTELQVSTQGTGTHLTRHGIGFGNYLTGLPFGYEANARQNNEEQTNRLAILRVAKLSNNSPIYNAFVGKGVDYGISILNDQILNYEGGPGSTYGVGTTIIKRATNTNTTRAYSSVAFSYDTLMDQTTTTGYRRAHPKLQDFRAVINNQFGNQSQMVGNYEANNIETRLGAGNPGAPIRNRVDYTSEFGSNYTVDRLNALPPFSNETAGKPWELLVNGGTLPAKDIVKFVFECMSSDEPGDSIALIFRSFLTGLTDNHQADFNSFKYLGRGETFRTYQGFDRSISFSFKIAAFTRAEMVPLYTKLNHLISQIYPDYSPTSRFMRGNVIKLTIGDYLYRVPGFLENVNITIDDNAAWEIALNDPEMRELPQMITVQCSFKPIHDILPRRARINDEYVPLIANTPIPYLMETVATGQFNFKKPQPVVNEAEQRRNNMPAPNPQFQPVAPIVIPDAPLRNRTGEMQARRASSEETVVNRTADYLANRP